MEILKQHLQHHIDSRGAGLFLQTLTGFSNHPTKLRRMVCWRISNKTNQQSSADSVRLTHSLAVLTVKHGSVSIMPGMSNFCGRSLDRGSKQAGATLNTQPNSLWQHYWHALARLESWCWQTPLVQSGWDGACKQDGQRFEFRNIPKATHKVWLYKALTESGWNQRHATGGLRYDALVSIRFQIKTRYRCRCF